MDDIYCLSLIYVLLCTSN